MSPAAQATVRRVEARDRAAILAVVEATGFFRPGELVTAAEVLDESIRDGAAGHYQSHVIEADGRPVGWVCWGPTPCTVGTFDIYWIAVDAACQGRGHGKRLLLLAEQEIRKAGGRLAIIETSGQSLYESTQQFYLRCGYVEAARVADFYSEGDDKIIYVRRLDH